MQAIKLDRLTKALRLVELPTLMNPVLCSKRSAQLGTFGKMSWMDVGCLLVTKPKNEERT
jgi:hypothetical protein